MRNQFYVPASTVPETFENGMGATGTQRWINSVISSSSGGSIPVAGDVNFVLTSPEEAGRFLTYTAPALEALGCRVELLPNNYRSFRDTAGPMERSRTMASPPVARMRPTSGWRSRVNGRAKSEIQVCREDAGSGNRNLFTIQVILLQKGYE